MGEPAADRRLAGGPAQASNGRVDAGFVTRLLVCPAAAVRLALCALCCASAGLVAAQKAEPTGPVVLRERFAVLQAQADRNPLGPRLYLQSSESDNRLQGDVVALVDHPYDAVRAALGRADPWCGILILHLNVKYCRAGGGTAKALDMAVGRKFDQPLRDAYWLRLAYRVAVSRDDYLQVVLEGPSGPMGTRDYLIQVDAVPFDSHRSLLHMAYGYSYDSLAGLAMSTYLATFGNDKVGFSAVGTSTSGQPLYVRGVRGVVERNAMRYYLAIDAYLGARALPAAQQPQRSLQDWFAATERHARQLHEMDREAYLAMKQHEMRRQLTELPPPG
jgi:hypothetical protein